MTSTTETPKQAARRLMAGYLNKGYEAESLHTYTDSKGGPLHWRIRLKHKAQDKVIRPMALINGAYELKEPPYPDGKPLYNQFKIASEPTAPIWIVEGEKCADELNKLGLIATTSGGADSAKTTRWEPLTGREVIIWRDNDTAGLKYQTDIAEILHPLNCKIKFVDVEALSLTPKADCVDWLADFETQQGRKAELSDLLSLPLVGSFTEAPTGDYLNAGDTTTKTNTQTQPSDNETQPRTRKDDEVITELATLSPIEYDRVRASTAKALKVRPGTLDMMVKQARADNQESESPFQDIEPWHEAINPAEILDDITGTIQRFIVFDKHQAQAAALWVSACWFVDVIQCAPIALINAPERACGKTQLLTVLAKLAPRTAQASGISPSVLFRMIETYRPTLFIDEVETILKDNEDLRGLINAGHTRDSAKVWRSVAKGDDFEPKCFSVWGMKAVAGINAIKLAETVTSRSIVFELRRKRAEENVTRLRHAEAGLFDELAAKLARFADDYASEVQQSRPHLPDELSDRDQDNWEPLLQIASVAGGHWPDTAVKAALKLSGASSSTPSVGNELLADIRAIFEAKGTTKISSTNLIEALCEDTEAPWATYNHGKQLTPRQLSTRLSNYGIASKDMRFAYDGVKKGYEVEQFTDAFVRYLSHPSENGHLSATPLQGNNGGAFSVADKSATPATRNISATLEPAPDKACSVVADKTSILGGREKKRSNDDDVMVF